MLRTSEAHENDPPDDLYWPNRFPRLLKRAQLLAPAWLQAQRIASPVGLVACTNRACLRVQEDKFQAQCCFCGAAALSALQTQQS